MHVSSSSRQPVAKGDGQIVKTIFLKKELVIQECFDVIKECNLDALVQKVKKHGFSELNKNKTESGMFFEGMIRLGEALTYCRDEGEPIVETSGVLKFAKVCANFRNYLVHKHMYFHHFPHLDELNRYINEIPLIEEVKRGLGLLKKNKLKDLIKQIKTGGNSFPFQYSHFVVCLENEFKELEELMERIERKDNTAEELEKSLESRVRNILNIMIDLTSDSITNTNNEPGCSNEKKQVVAFHAEFETKDKEYPDFFEQLKSSRNALCHQLDEEARRPFTNLGELLGFTGMLRKLLKDGYIETLKNKFLTTEIQEESNMEAVDFAQKSATSLAPPPESSYPSWLPPLASDKKKRDASKNAQPSFLRYTTIKKNDSNPQPSVVAVKKKISTNDALEMLAGYGPVQETPVEKMAQEPKKVSEETPENVAEEEIVEAAVPSQPKKSKKDESTRSNKSFKK